MRTAPSMRQVKELYSRRLLHERPVGLHAVANSVRDWLGCLADQHVVGSWGGAGADTEQRIERGMPCSAPIEADHELVQLVLEVGPPQSVVNAQAPALEILRPADGPRAARCAPPSGR